MDSPFQHDGDESVADAMHRRKITRLEDELRCARMEYASFCNRKRAIYTLPTEVLALIFEECVRGDPFSYYDITMCALALSHTSRHFRDVAVSTPSLWCNLDYMLGYDSEPDLYLFSTAVCLERSKASPLRISLKIYDADVTHDDIVRLLDMLVPHVHRWQKFHIAGFLKLALPIYVGRLSNADAPMLKCLCVEYENDVYDIEPPDSTIFGSGAPCLTSVAFCCILPKHCLPPLASVARVQIKNLGHPDEFSHALPVLNGLSNLAHLNIIDNHNLDCSLSTVIELPALITLAVSSESNSELIPGLLAALSAPLLQSLILLGVDNDDLETLFTLVNLSQPPKFPALSSLTIDNKNGGIEKELLDQLTIFIPHVTDFTFISTNPNDPMGTHGSIMGLGESGLAGWPSLNTFTLKEWIPYRRTPRPEHVRVALFELLNRRKIAGCRIRNLRIPVPVFDEIESMGLVASLDSFVDRYEICDFPQDDFLNPVETFWMNEDSEVCVCM